MAYCANCGNELSPAANACPQCGHPAAGARPTYAARRTEGTAVASLALGIAGLIVCPLVCSILAIVFGNQAKQRLETDRTLEGEGLAKAGIILGWVGVALGVIWILVFLSIVGGAGVTVREFPG